MKTPPQPLAYSYIRFSSTAQAEGDSLRRQTERAEDYCRRRGWVLDNTLTLRDLGVSAFHGKNALVGNLGTFLAAVKRGTVPSGSAIIVESVDRISRQGIDEGYDLIKSILKAGILLVTLSPEREFGPEAVKSLSRGALELQLILERAAEESERKSDRVGAAWSEKKKKAREGVIMTHRLPAWVQKVDGQLVLVPGAAATVRRIFLLSAAGYGIPSIVEKFTAEKVPAIGSKGKWTRSYVNLILRDRRAVGEYQPRKGKAKDGEAIANYYPAAVSEDEFNAARRGARERSTYRGRVGKAKVNLFAGLLKNARDDDAYTMTTRLSRSAGGKVRKFQVLINSRADQGDGRAYSLPYDVFERAVLSCLQEIDPHDILNGDHEPDETTALANELAGVEARMADLEAELLKGDVAALARVLRQLEERKRELMARLAEARQKAAHPLSESWGECQSLAETLAIATDPTDARLRLRSALRQIVKEIRLLVIPRRQDRLTAVQMWFAGGQRRRDYLLLYRPASGRRSASWWARSLADVAAPGDLDLRQRSHVRALEAALSAADLDHLRHLR